MATVFAVGVALLAFFAAVQIFRVVYPLVRAHRILNAQNIPSPAAPRSSRSKHDKKKETKEKKEKQPSLFDPALHRLGLLPARKYGDIIRIPIGPWNVFQVSDPFIMAEIWDRNKYPQLVDKPRGFPFLVYSALDSITTPPRPNLLTAATSDPNWKFVRKALAPAFSAIVVKRDGWPIVADMGARANKTLREIGPDTPVDMAHLLQCYALDVIGKFAFDREFNAVSDSSGRGAYTATCIRETANFIADSGKWCLAGPLRRFIIPDYRRKVEQKKFMEATLQDLMHETMKRGREAFAPGSVARILLDNREALGQERFFAELCIMFLAGMETTGNTMAWALYNISIRPKILAGVEAELDSLGLLKTPERPVPRAVEYDDLNKLVYLNACIKESQRFHPTAPMLFREAREDVKIGPYLIPKGTMMVLHLMAMYQSENVFDSPKEFMPERWFSPDADMARRPGEKPQPGSQVRRFLPFGDGSRKCIGGELGRVSLTATLARVFGNYRFSLAEKMGGIEGVEATESWAATLHARHGLFMHAVPR